jgi:hypothetical protein
MADAMTRPISVPGPLHRLRSRGSGLALRCLPPAALVLALAGIGGRGAVTAATLTDGVCVWTSEISPEAVIRFRPRTDLAGQEGELFLGKRRIDRFRISTSQGYGTTWWSLETLSGGRGERVVWFRGDAPLWSLTPVRGPAARRRPDRALIVGLGSRLWYGGDQRWRRRPRLIRAAEGFWTLGPGCTPAAP